MRSDQRARGGSNCQVVEDDISADSIAPSHFRQVLARTKTTALPRARVRALLLADPDALGSLAL